MSNKQLNEDSILNELKGSSLFFKKEKEEPPAVTEKHPVTPPVKAIPAPQDSEPRLGSSVSLSAAQSPVQPPTNPIGETAENLLSPAPAVGSPSAIESNPPSPQYEAESRNPGFASENNQEFGKHEGAPDPTRVRPNESAPVRTSVRIKRTITRYAFEFFQDQLTTLKSFSLEEQLRGERGSMSQMVREALDAYIAKRKRTEE